MMTRCNTCACFVVALSRWWVHASGICLYPFSLMACRCCRRRDTRGVGAFDSVIVLMQSLFAIMLSMIALVSFMLSKMDGMFVDSLVVVFQCCDG